MLFIARLNSRRVGTIEFSTVYPSNSILAISEFSQNTERFSENSSRFREILASMISRNWNSPGMRSRVFLLEPIKERCNWLNWFTLTPEDSLYWMKFFVIRSEEVSNEY